MVTAFYLLNYARNRDELAAFCRSCFRALRPARLNDNVRATYDSAMRDSGFGEFRWIDAALDPSERQDPIWDEFLAQLL